MKKIKKYFIKGVVMVCVLSLFSMAVLWYAPTKKAKADEVKTSYITYEIIGVNQIRFIIYILDAYTIEELPEVNVNIMGLDENGHQYYMFGEDTQFLRFQSLDNLDYDAYIWNHLASENEIENALFYFFEYNYVETEQGELTFVDDNYFPNILKNFKQYSRGYDEGFNFGYADGIEEGYGNGLEIGYRDGITEGYAEGFNDGESSQIDVNFMQSIFTSLDAFFQIHFAPNLTIGELFLAPLIIWFVWFIIKQFKGGD